MYKADTASNMDARTDDTDSGTETKLDSSDADAWTDDWKADMARGVMLGQRYQAIGNAIDEHYRKSFNSSDNHDSDGNFDWKDDRELGSSIGDNYKLIGKAIEEHYQQAFDNNDNINSARDTNSTNSDGDGHADDWATKWKQYKKKGQEIANYYKGKGKAIDEFYKGKYSLEGMAPPTVNLLESATIDTPHATLGNISTDEVTATVLNWVLTKVR